MFLLVGAGSAAAHGEVAGPEPTSVAVVLGIEPAVSGLSLTVVEGGARLRLDNATGGPVDVLPPPGTPRRDEPVVAPGASAAWADPRLADAPPTAPAAGAAWEIPLLAGGRAVTVRGERVWPADPAPAPWWALTAAVALGTFSLGGTAALRRHDRRPHRGVDLALAGVTLAVVAGHVVHVLGATAVLADPPSVGLVLGAVGIGLVGWVFGPAGAGLIATGRPLGLPVAAAAGAVTALLTAFDTPGFHRAVLASGWSFDLDRATTVVAFGGGLGLLLAGWAALSAGSGGPAGPAAAAAPRPSRPVPDPGETPG